jgi:hypothetical protein
MSKLVNGRGQASHTIFLALELVADGGRMLNVTTLGLNTTEAQSSG